MTSAGFFTSKFYDMNTDDQPCHCADMPAVFSRMEVIDRRLDEHEQKHAACTTNHEKHNQYRRENDNKMIPIIKCLEEQKNISTEQSRTLTRILEFMELNSPIINRAKRNFTIWDNVKEGFRLSWELVKNGAAAITLLCGAAAAVYGVIQIITKFPL